MPFLPEQMSPESLRRLVKAQRRALSAVLGVEATQAQAQEVLARTFGFEHWHELNKRLQQRPDPTPYASEEDDARWMDPGMQDLVNPKLPEHLTQSIARAKREMESSARLSLGHYTDRLFEVVFPGINREGFEKASQKEMEQVLWWLGDDLRRLKDLSFEHQRALDRRLAAPETPLRLTAARDALLETAWNDRSLFSCALGLIPTNQIWPWLHRAALARNIAMMTRIHEARERAIGSEPFHALANAVFNRDGEHVKRLIEAQCRRYGLAVDDLGGQQRGGPRATSPASLSHRRRP